MSSWAKLASGDGVAYRKESLPILLLVTQSYVDAKLNIFLVLPLLGLYRT